MTDIPAEQPERPAPAFFWPYLVFAPFPYAVLTAVIGIGMARALGGEPASNMLMGFLLAYVLLGTPALALAWLHRKLYRSSGRHRLGPILGLTLGLATLTTLALLIVEGQRRGPTGQELATLFAILAGGAMALALIGFCAVWLIDKWRRAGART